MEGTAQTILSSAGQLLTEEYRLLRGVGGEVAELRDDLATMNALIRMQSEAEDGAVDHFVREWMRQLRELAYDSDDCVDLYRLRIKSRPSDGVRAWLGHLIETLFPRRRLAGEIRALHARATAIAERHARYYGLNRDALPRSAALAAHPVLLSASASTAEALRRSTNDDDGRSSNDDDGDDTAGGGLHQPFVGIGKQAGSLVDQLQERGDERGYPKVLSIVGFGGVGKTTLAMELCRRLEAAFPYQATVSVSQAFEPSRDMKVLLKRMLQQVVKPKTENERGIKEEGALDIDKLDADEMVEKLQETLKDKRYLIVVDDVWSIHAWEEIQSKLPETNCASRAIVTTRIESVAKACSFTGTVNGHDYIYHMEPLQPEDSKKLFLSRVFGSTSTKYPQELSKVMDDILKKCGRLPLAIVSIASVLAGYKSAGSIDKWERVCRSIGSQMESNPTLDGMRHIVTLSYNHLPHELKNCMLYLSIFPEDYEINRDRLLWRWIAEGLVPEKRGLTPMEVAESYLDELVSRNMVVPHYGFDGKVESCKVHDMLLEVMVCKSLECNFVSLLGGQYDGMSYGRIRRLSIQGDDEAAKKAAGKQKQKQKHKEKMMEGVDVEHVRSLSMFQLQRGHRLLGHLDKFALLRVLDLEDCEGLTNDHMTYVCRLYLLRFLSVKGTTISELPRQVGKLEHLQTLDAIGTNLEGLPETVTSLEKLERVELLMWTLPRGVGKMKALRNVQTALLNDDIPLVARELGELQMLQSLAVWIDCKNDSPILLVLADSLGKLQSLRRLDITQCNDDTGDMAFYDTGDMASDDTGDMASDDTGDMAFPHDLPTPPRLLRFLSIDSPVLKQLPNWVGSLTYLVEFEIRSAELVGDQLFGVLCKLPSLKSIWMLDKCYRGEELVALTSHNFPALSSLKVISFSVPEPKVLRFEQRSMTWLQTLHVSFGDLQERSIVGIEHLTGLKEVELNGQKDNPALQRALDLLKDENSRRSQKFQVVVKYYG